MVLGQGLLLTLVASAIGLGAAVVLTRFMASMLFNVAPRDPLTFALVARRAGVGRDRRDADSGAARDARQSDRRAAGLDRLTESCGRAR